ncbi:MAG: hypothetical protein LBI34_00415 [Puniceicoccales bacterium]|jgi:hypothetical protein|nr:hypothetical protein [Puniceicoccales bacterium]
MSIELGRSCISWATGSSPDGEKRAVSITLKSVRDAFQLGGFGRAFSYAVNCLVKWDTAQEVTATEEEAANFIALNLNDANEDQIMDLCKSSDTANAPIIELVLKAGSADARKNILQFFQDGKHDDYLKQLVHVSHDEEQQVVTIAKLISASAPDDDLTTGQFDAYCQTNNIPFAAHEMCTSAHAVAEFLEQNEDLDGDIASLIRGLPNGLVQLAASLQSAHSCQDIEEGVKSVFGANIGLCSSLNREAHDVFWMEDVRAQLIEVLKGAQGKALPNLLPLDSPIRFRLIEPLCNEFGIQYDEVDSSLAEGFPGKPTLEEGTRYCAEVNRLISLNTPESIYLAMRLLHRDRNFAIRCAQRFPESCAQLGKIFSELQSSFETIRQFTSQKTQNLYDEFLRETALEINNLSEREPIPEMPAGTCPLANDQKISTYMHGWMNHVEGLIRWYRPGEARELFQKLILTDSILSHLADEDVERLDALLSKESPDGISPEKVSTTANQMRFDENKRLIAKRLAWTEGRIDSAFGEVAPQNCHEKLFQKDPNGLTLFGAILKANISKYETKLMQMFESMDREKFLKVINTDANGKAIFTFLCRNEAGCALLERHLAKRDTFIQLMHNHWFGPDEFHFFTQIRGIQIVAEQDDDGNFIERDDWICGVASSQFFLEMIQDDEVLCAAMQNPILLSAFLRAMASYTGKNMADTLSPEKFISLMHSEAGLQIFATMHSLANGAHGRIVRNLFIGLLENKKVVVELSKISWLGTKLIAALTEYDLPFVEETLLQDVCSAALLGSDRMDEAVSKKILATSDSRVILWNLCNELVEKYGEQARVIFSRLTQSEAFRNVTIGHEPGHTYAVSSGIPEVLTEMGTILTSKAKRALLLGEMASETTYGESYTKYSATQSSPLPAELLIEKYESQYRANFAQEMLRKHSDELFTLLDGMDPEDVTTVLSRRANNGCTLLEFSVLNRRDSTVMKLADYYRKRGISFSRIEIREMLVFKGKTFEDSVEELARAERITAEVRGSVGGYVASAHPDRAELEEISKKYSIEKYGKRCFRLRAAALDELRQQRLAEHGTKQSQLLEMITICQMAIAEGEAQKEDVSAYREELNTLCNQSAVGVSGRIKLAVSATRGDANGQAAYDQYMDAFIGESPDVAKSTKAALDDRILNATSIQFIERDAAGWLARIGGIDVRIESIAELAQCQNLEAINFDPPDANSLFLGTKLTADELFALRNVKALKKLKLGQFSKSLTPNLVEIFFRARQDLSISAIATTGQELVWDHGVVRGQGQYSCRLNGRWKPGK